VELNLFLILVNAIGAQASSNDQSDVEEDLAGKEQREDESEKEEANEKAGNTSEDTHSDSLGLEGQVTDTCGTAPGTRIPTMARAQPLMN